MLRLHFCILKFQHSSLGATPSQVTAIDWIQLDFEIDCFHIYRLGWVSGIELVVPHGFQLPNPSSFPSLSSRGTWSLRREWHSCSRSICRLWNARCAFGSPGLHSRCLGKLWTQNPSVSTCACLSLLHSRPFGQITKSNAWSALPRDCGEVRQRRSFCTEGWLYLSYNKPSKSQFSWATKTASLRISSQHI